MPTIFSHIAVPLALGLGLGPKAIPRRLMVAGMAASVLPDADVVSFLLGVPYGDAFGHRGFSHSLAFAVLLGVMAAVFARRRLGASSGLAFVFVMLSGASHGLLDMLTNGGNGVALFWPVTDERYFFPATPIAVSPIGLTRFLTARGGTVLLSELQWIWLPAVAVVASLRLWRGYFLKRS